MTVIDYLTCGGCQTEFPLNNIVTFMEHKKVDCLTSTQLYPTQAVDYGFTNYSCYTCPKKFGAAVSLLQHAQFQHKLNVYISSAVNDIPKTADTVSKNSSSDSHDIQENGRPTTNVVGTPATTSATFSNNADNDDTTEISEPLSKCCTSVVPKKRKRHFETKHRSSFFKNSRLKRQVQQSTMPSDIYINLEPSILSTHMRGGMMGDPNSGSEGDSQSVLLQPGKTVTIPIPSSDPPSHFRSITRDANSPSNNSSTSGSYQPLSSQNSSNTKEQPVETPESLSPVLSENSHDNSASRKKYPTSKPFKCDHCGDSFNQRIHLKKHLSKHTGVKPYKCGQCDYATVERSHLKVHIRIHTGEKPFKCTYCTYATAQNSTLKIHLKRHHGGALSLECTHCGKFFPEKKQLLSHKEEHGKGADK